MQIKTHEPAFCLSVHRSSVLSLQCLFTSVTEPNCTKFLYQIWSDGSPAKGGPHGFNFISKCSSLSVYKHHWSYSLSTWGVRLLPSSSHFLPTKFFCGFICRRIVIHIQCPGATPSIILVCSVAKQQLVSSLFRAVIRVKFSVIIENYALRRVCIERVDKYFYEAIDV